MCRSRTVNVSTKDRECADQRPEMYRPTTGNVQTKDPECADQRPGMYRPTTGRKKTGKVLTKDRECTDQEPGTYLTLTRDLAVPMLDGGTVWGHDKIPCREGGVAHFNARSRRADVGWWNRVKTR